MPWIKEERLYPILVLILIFIMAVRMPLDTDMWWHLRAGEETIRAGQVYRVDTFSSSRAGEDWINHSWLSQVLMAGLARLGGPPSLSVWVAVCAVFSMGLVYLQMEGHPLLRGAVLVVAAMVSSVVWSPRPQIMSLVMLALLSWLMHIYQEKRSRTSLYSIPLVFMLWGNLHGGYVLGVIYLGAFLAGELLDRVLIREDKEGLAWRDLGMIGAVMILGFALVLINPFGLAMWKIPFNTIGVETLQNLISEWASPDFHQAYQQPLLWMMLGLLGVLGLSGERMKGNQLVPSVVFAWGALVARRNFGPFAIVSAPLLAAGLSGLLTGWLDRASKELPTIENFLQKAGSSKDNFSPTLRNVLNVVLIGLLLMTAIIKTIQVNQPAFVERIQKEHFPVGATAWLRAQEGDFQIFNDYNWGGYLIYHLPESPVFVDGRTDLYGDEILRDYIDVISGKEDWMDILDSYGLDTLVIPVGSNLAETAERTGWITLYVDGVAVVMRASTD